MNEIKGKCAVITGAAGGIGEATARLFAREGASHIVLSDLNYDTLEFLGKEIEEETGCRCHPVTTDLGNIESIRELFRSAGESMKRLGILVNCAGICPVDPIESVTPEGWDRTMDINLRGMFFCCQEAVSIMKPFKSGSIVNLSSISGRIGGIVTGVDYVATKGAILAMTKAIAKSVGPDGITVNNVSPGFIATQMTKNFTHFDPATVPLRRIGEPEDVADVILFLSSRRSRYITGCTLDVTGGLYMN